MATEITSLQEQVEEQAAHAHKKFGTFTGVFTPTALTILGVIMYLRTGAVVGNAGLLGAWLIMALACGITLCTALSLASIVTNIRIGAGGAYSIISQSLGLEMGGSVGIPLYLSQALAVTMYIFGFREGWQTIFPGHPALLVDLLTFLVLFAIAFISANFAFRIQLVIMGVIAASLVAIFGTVFTGALRYEPQLWGGFEGFPETGFTGTSFWFVFAIFFPAVTGIMAGANMSGDLKDPRRSIPVGTLAAVALTTVVYFAIAYWLARVATPEELVSNYTIAIDRALWPPLVIAGLLGATFSSGLASLVGAPRIMTALGFHGILPRSPWFSRLTRRGEPRNAMLVTGGIVLAGLLLRDLNAIAPLITMFFLITYAMINAVVLMEQSLDLVSFRPLFRVNRLIPLAGAVGCLFVMFIVNPVFSLLAVGLVVGIYVVLLRRRLPADFADMRSGLFVALAEWGAKQVTRLPTAQERAWKPNLLVPVENLPELRGSFEFISDLTVPRGSIKLVGVTCNEPVEVVNERLPALAHAFREDGVFASWTRIDDSEFGRGLLSGMQALNSAFFRPNVVFLTMPAPGDHERQEEMRMIVDKAREHRMGVLLFADHPRAHLGRKQTINVWIRDKSPDWQVSMQLGNMDLALLTAYILMQKWEAKLSLITAVRDPAQKVRAAEYLHNVIELARLPHTSVQVLEGPFFEQVTHAPVADLTSFGLSTEIDFDLLGRLVQLTRSSCLFVRDSGEENVLA
ncbi:amino acid permease [soil metagenome]